MITVFRRLVSFALRLALLAVGLVFGAVLLVVGLFVTLVLLVLSLLRGRRPQVVRFRVDPRSPFTAHVRPTPHANAEVVDIEARVVPDDPQRLSGDRRG